MAQLVRRRPTPYFARVDASWRRAIALDFVNGAARWEHRELALLCASLHASGLLGLDPGAVSVQVREPGHAALSVDLLPGEPRAAGREDPAPLLRAARGRVLAVLRAFLDKQQDDRFVHAALFASRVERLTVRGATRWAPRLAEGQALSDWVLALLAADVLEDREGLVARLAICSDCEHVSVGGHACAPPLAVTRRGAGTPPAARSGGAS